MCRCLEARLFGCLMSRDEVDGEGLCSHPERPMELHPEVDRSPFAVDFI